MISALQVFLRRGWILGALLLVVAGGAFAQDRPFVAGELLVWVKEGAGTANDVAKAANAAGADVVRPLLARDMYLLRVRGKGGAVATHDETTTSAATLKNNTLFRWAAPNYTMKYLDSTPNDPRYGEQWGLPLMKLPQAWDTQKGQSNVIIMILDSGTDVNYPDLKDRLMGVQNFGDPANPTNVTDNVPHGTHVMGIAAATTNNAIGVAGVAWEKVRVFFAKLGDAPSYSAAVDAITYARNTLNKNGNRVVLNMSFGNDTTSDQPDPSDPLDAAILAAAKEDIISCISAGNSYDQGNPPGHPANDALLHPNILCVAAVGPNKEHAFYSSARSYTTIAAPGGNDPSFANNSLQILSTLPNSAYGFEQGTSMAAPAVAGVVALMLSNGIAPSDVRNVLIDTADTLGQAVPNPLFGYGLVDASQAVLGAGAVYIVEPLGTGGKASGQATIPDPVETLRPSIRIRVSRIFPANLTVTVDGVNVTDYTITNITATAKDSNGVDAPSRYEIVFNRDLAPGQHTITVNGVKVGPPDVIVTDTRNFIIAPHQVPAGRSLISIPYFQDLNNDGLNDVTPETYFGTDFRLARWLPDQQRYVFYTSFGPKDPDASFAPSGTPPHLDGDPTAKLPLGLAFWSDTESVKPILTRGKPLDTTVVIPLKGNGSGDTRFVSWNMVGDPFPFDIPFNALLVDLPDGSRLSIGDAVNRGLILPNIYTYDGTEGYTFRTLPDGALRAWTGHWIGVTSSSDIALVVPPAKLTRAATTLRGPEVGSNGWALRLGATVRNLRDTYNFIGVASRAADAYDRNDVLKPPSVSPYVTLAVQHDDWGRQSGAYAQDLRSPGGRKSWDIVVNTDQPNSDVTVSWPGGGSLPRSVKLTIRDTVSGQVVDMRTRSAITYHTGTDLSPRRFTITASPASTSLLRISSLAVRSTGGRASGTQAVEFTLSGDATYDVKVLSAAGVSLGSIGSRAASAGNVRLLWNGKDSQGRSVPAGTYLVQVRAVGPDGDSIKVVQPFAVVR